MEFKTLIFKCRYCGKVEKSLLEPEEMPIYPDGYTVRGMCETCLETYQKKGFDSLGKADQG